MDKPAHRKKIGSAIWLFLYLLVNADRKTGALFRKIRTIANDMETTRDTVMRWLVILRRGEYIATRSNGRHLSIQINKWRTSEEAVIRQRERRMQYHRSWDNSQKATFAESRNDANISTKNGETSFPIYNSINKNLYIHSARSSQDRTFVDFKPQDKEELLALDIADALSDRSNLPHYISNAKKYPEQLLRGILGAVMEIPAEKIQKSRKALFIHVLQKHEQQTNHNPRN